MARLIDESFEGVGYETASVTVTSGSPDPDWPLREDANGALPPGSGTEGYRVTGTTTDSHNISFPSQGNQSVGCVRFALKIDALSWATPTSGEFVGISKLTNATPADVVRPIIYYDGSTYRFSIRYYDGSWHNDFTAAQGFAYQTNIWYRIEYKYDYTNKLLSFHVYNLAGTALFSRSDISMAAGVRYLAHLHLGLQHSLGKDVTVDMTYDQVVFDNATYPIGAESDHSFSVVTLRPTSTAFFNGDWIASSGAAHECLDDTSPDDDATYVEASCVINPSNCFLGFTPTPGGKILAVRMRARVKAIPGGLGPRLAARDPSGTAYNPENKTKISAAYDTYGYWRWDWETNPETGLPWTWADIAIWSFGFQALATMEGAGGRITQFEIQIIQGSYKDRFISVGPVCSGVAPDALGFAVRCAQPPLVADTDAFLKLRYGTDPTMATYTELTGQALASADWTKIFYISSGLQPDTTYYVDVLASPDGSTNWRSLQNYPTTLGYYPAYKTHPNTGEVKICVNSDMHGETHDDIIRSIVADAPRLILSLGDTTDDHQGDISRIRNALRYIYGGSEYFVENVVHKLPLERIWDDHDVYSNDATKFTWYTFSDGSQQFQTAAGRANSFKGFFEWTPSACLPPEARLTGTATAGTSGTTLTANGLTFNRDNVHALATYGAAWFHNTTTDASTMVVAIPTEGGHSLTLADSGKVAEGDTFEIINGPFRKIRCGYVDIFLLDLRSQRDDGQILSGPQPGPAAPGADMMDGVLMASPSALNPAKSTGSTAGVSDNQITTSAAVIASPGDVIQNATTAVWAQVVSVEDTTHLTLNVQIFSGSGINFSIYESGASHGDNAHGHIQRDWWLNEMASSEAEWRGVCSSVNFNVHSVRENETWGDYDTFSANALRCQRNYVASAIQDANDVFYLSSDKHAPAIDSGADTEPTGNVWPEMCSSQPGNYRGTSVYGSWDIGYQDKEAGTTTSGGDAYTFYDTDRAWTPNELIGFVAIIDNGAGTVRARTITGNTATVITVGTSWGQNIGAGWTYSILVPNYGIIEVTQTSISLRALRADGTEFSFSPFIVQATALTVSLPAYIGEGV